MERNLNFDVFLYITNCLLFPVNMKVMSEVHVKSVQSADLKCLPERLQSQCNYQQHLNGTLSETKLRPNLPKRNRQW